MQVVRESTGVISRGKFFVHWLATMEVISAVFETFIMVILWLQRGTVVRADLKPHLI
jgi:hypothetical protein